MSKANASVVFGISEQELCDGDGIQLRDCSDFSALWNWAQARHVGQIFPQYRDLSDASSADRSEVKPPMSTTDIAAPTAAPKSDKTPKPRPHNVRGSRLRSALFSFLFYTFSTILTFIMGAASLLKGNRLLIAALQLWAKGVVKLMYWIVGIQVDVRGREHIPQAGQYLVAAKHQAYCDGIVMLSELPALSFVAEESNLKWPIFGRILKKLDAVLVDTCGGETQRRKVSDGGRQAAARGKSILIYPEGRLVPVGEPTEYKAGIYYLYADLGLPVLPVATNIGQFWQCRRWRKFGGAAAVEFLAPIQPGLGKDEFMALLEGRIEGATQQLVEGVS